MRTKHGEKTQAQSVEKLNRIVHALHPWVGCYRQQSSQRGNSQVAPVRQAGGRRGAYCQVAQHTATASHDIRQRQHTEQIQPFLPGCNGAAKRKSECAQQIEHGKWHYSVQTGLILRSEEHTSELQSLMR